MVAKVLPAVLSIGVEEYFWGANTTLWLYASLTVGAAHCIDVFCDETTKANYLPPMYEGKWTGAMALTEAHAGTDLGLLRTRATRRGRRLVPSERYENIHYERGARLSRKHHTLSACEIARRARWVERDFALFSSKVSC